MAPMGKIWKFFKLPKFRLYAKQSRDLWFYGMVMRVSQLNGIIKFTSRTTHVAIGNKIWDKIGYNSASIRDIYKIFAPSRGFMGSGY